MSESFQLSVSTIKREIDLTLLTTYRMSKQTRQWRSRRFRHHCWDSSIATHEIRARAYGKDTYISQKMCHCSQEFHRCRQWHMIMFTPTSSFLLHCSPITMTYFQFQVLSLNNLLSPVSAAHPCMDVGLSTWESGQWSHPPKKVTLLSQKPPALLRMTSTPSMLELWSCGSNCSCCERV